MYQLHLLIVTLPKLAKRLTATVGEAFFTYARLAAFLFMKRIQKDDRGWLFTFTYRNTRFDIKLFEGSPDIAALKEIFIDGEYDWDEVKDPKSVVDLGGHTGNTAIYFHIKYPNAQIYVVEASSKNFTRLLENVSKIPNIHPVFGAVSDTDGTLTFYESESSLGSSVHKRGDGSREIVVPCFTLSTLFREQGLTNVDVMKIDIEGSEDKLFTTASPEVFARQYIIEVHEDLMNQKTDFVQQYFQAFRCRRLQLQNKDRYILYATKT